MEIKPVQGNQPLLKMFQQAQPGSSSDSGQRAATPLQATVLATSPQTGTGQASGKMFELLVEIKGQRFWLQSPRPLNPGQVMQLSATDQQTLKVDQLLPPNPKAFLQQQLALALSLQSPPQKLLQLTQQMPRLGPEQTSWPRELVQTVRQLQQAPVPLPKMTEPGQLKTALERSGLFLENRLMQAGQQLAGKERAATTTPINDTKATLGKLFAQLQQLQQTTHRDQTQPSSKWQQISQQLQNAFAREGSNTPTSALPKGLQTMLPLLQTLVRSSAEATPDANVKQNPSIPFFLQFVPPPPQSAEAPPPTAKDWVDQLIRAVASNLFRLQANQLHSLTQQTQQDQPTATLLNFEIPIAVGQQTQFVHLRMEEQAAEESKPQQKQKVWRVHLAFDMDTLGPVTVELTFTQYTAGILFWATEQRTLQLANEHLNVLQQHISDLGLEVNQLETRLGAPTLPKSILKQNLVDVHT